MFITCTLFIYFLGNAVTSIEVGTGVGQSSETEIHQTFDVHQLKNVKDTRILHLP